MIEVDTGYAAGATNLSYAFTTDAPITGVVGASGSGKTTLLHLVAGLLRPARGRIIVEGRVLFDQQKRVDVPVHRRQVGFVFQDDRLLPHRTVCGNLLYGAARRNAAGIGAITFDRVATLLNLGSLVERRVRHLSGGERQRVALGRALLSAPRLLLLDEPASALDAAHTADLLRLVRLVRDELRLLMLYVSHALSEVLQLTDHLLVIDGGRSVACGPLHEVARGNEAWRALRGAGAANVLAMRVAGHDREAGLTRLALPGEGPEGGAAGRDVVICGPLIDRPAGDPMHVSIRPQDVALSLGAVEGVSIQNQLPASVTCVTPHADRSLVQVSLAAGAALLVEVSHRTVREMQLEPGRAVRCLIKSNAVRYD